MLSIQEDKLFTKEIDRLNLTFSTAAFAQLPPGFTVNSVHPAFTRIYGILEGNGVIYCNDKAISMKPGNLYILPTGMDFSYVCHTAVEKVYYHIQLPRYDKFDLFRHIKNGIIIPQKKEEICRAASWLRRTDAFCAAQTKSWLFQIVLQAFQVAQVDFGSIDEYSTLVKQAFRYIEEHYHSGISITAIANALLVSKSRLEKVFRQEVGIPIGRYANDQLFCKADRLLRLTDRTIKDISTELGFCDPFYFSRFFKERVGTSPQFYRKMIST